IVAPGHRYLRGTPAARHASDAGNDFDVEAIRKPDVKMHEGPKKKRVALADERDVAASEKMRRDGSFGVRVEAAQLPDIGGVAEVGFRRQRIEQWQLDACAGKPAIED